MKIDIIEKIQNAEMVLIGIGEEFDQWSQLDSDEDFCNFRSKLTEEGSFILPFAANHKLSGSKAVSALNKLAEILKDKNYYVVSTTIHVDFSKTDLKQDRIVAPCGDLHKKQCVNKCEGSVQEITDDEWDSINASFTWDKKEIDLGICSQCGEKLAFNNVYLEKYDETGYLSKWQFYTKWIQGTMNHKVLILELGVNLNIPSVIRFPFEKLAFYNQKAEFVRVNEKLYHLNEELNGKGISVSHNAIDWILDDTL